MLQLETPGAGRFSTGTILDRVNLLQTHDTDIIFLTVNTDSPALTLLRRYYELVFKIDVANHLFDTAVLQF